MQAAEVPIAVPRIWRKRSTPNSKMLSRMGKMTRYNYPVFYGIDPISLHEKFLANEKRKEEFGNVDHEKQAKEEAKLESVLRSNNSNRSKTDIESFMKRMVQ